MKVDILGCVGFLVEQSVQADMFVVQFRLHHNVERELAIIGKRASFFVLRDQVWVRAFFEQLADDL